MAETWRSYPGYGLSAQRCTLEGRAPHVVGSAGAGARAGAEQTSPSVTRLTRPGIVALAGTREAEVRASGRGTGENGLEALSRDAIFTFSAEDAQGMIAYGRALRLRFGLSATPPRRSQCLGFPRRLPLALPQTPQEWPLPNRCRRLVWALASDATRSAVAGD